uniref:Prolactin-releasing peptide receptor-like n=1 Tax=Gouania willdenowi TaxID=441366 RepID=A0A8C5GJV2_GOUWI
MDWEKLLNQSWINSSSLYVNSSYCPTSAPTFSGFDLLYSLKYLFIPLYFVVALIACTGNLLLLFIICRNKKRHNTTNFLISNLALVDLVMCVFCIPATAFYAFERRGWIFGQHMCIFVAVMQSAAVYAAVLSLTAIAVDRYIVVAYPIRRRAGCQFCWGLVILIWLFSLALSTPTALHTVHLDLRAAGLHTVICEEFWDGKEQGRIIYSCFILFFSYFIPLAAVSISYCAISYQLRQGTKCPELRSVRAAWSRRRKKTFCLLLISVLCFALSWLPLQVVNLIRDLDTDFVIIGKKHVNIVQVSSHLLAMSSACYNPFIYASLHKKFLSCLCRHFLSMRRRLNRNKTRTSSVFVTMNKRSNFTLKFGLESVSVFTFSASVLRTI